MRSVEEVYKSMWDTLKNQDTLYVYKGMLVYINKITFIDNGLPDKNMVLEFSFVNTKGKRTKKEACSIYYERFLEELKSGKMKEHTSDVKTIPVRMRGHKLYIYFSHIEVICDCEYEFYNAVVYTKDRAFHITHGHIGYSGQKEIKNKVYTGECYVNSSSHGESITFRSESFHWNHRNGDMQIGLKHGEQIQELSIDEANNICVEKRLQVG